MKNTIIWVVVVAVVILGLVWMNKKKEPISGEPIKIGAIISQTGVASAFGEMSKYGIEMAVKEINEGGGIDGRLIEVVYEDDRTDPKAALGLYQKLTGIDHVDAIIGSNFDFVTQPIFAVAKDGDTVIISPSNPRIAGVFDTNSHSFVMMSDFSKIIYSLESYLSSSEYKKLAVVHFDSGFGAEIVKTLAAINQKLGKPEVTNESYKQIGNNDFRTIILKLKQAGVDAVFLDMVTIDPVTFMNQSKQLGYKPQVITYDSVKDSLAIEGTDKSLFDGVVVLNWNMTPESFDKKFREMYKIDPANSVNRAYDAIYILAEAISKAKEKSEIPTILENTKFKTPNGTFQFSPEHAAQNTETAIQVIKGGKLIKLEQ